MQLDELLRAAREVPENHEDLTSQPGPPQPVEVPTEPPRKPEEPSRDDLDTGMDAVKQMTSLEGAGETESSTEIREQPMSWRGREASTGQQTLAEITAGSPQLKRARLEEPLDNEQEKTGRTKRNCSVPRTYS